MIKLGKYKHYKGNLYKVLGVVKHSETLEDLVLYECLYEKQPLQAAARLATPNKTAKFWVRPLKMFSEKVSVNGKMTPRFEYLKDE